MLYRVKAVQPLRAVVPDTGLHKKLIRGIGGLLQGSYWRNDFNRNATNIGTRLRDRDTAFISNAS